MNDILQEVSRVQRVLKAPKNQYNSFGGYNYRSCEDILEALKLITNFVIAFNDDIVVVGDNVYVKTKVTFYDPSSTNTVSATAFAREPVSRKGQDPAQITGASSSYARKYALNALFAIDDSKDPDITNIDDDTKNTKNTKNKQSTQKHKQTNLEKNPWYNDFDIHKKIMESEIKQGKKTVDQIISNLKENYRLSNDIINKIKALGM